MPMMHADGNIWYNSRVLFCRRYALEREEWFMMEEMKRKLKIREEDPIMNEVYATRHKISAYFGNNPKRYIESIREMNRNATAAGMSFLAYCQSIVGKESVFPIS